jgi:hypothetical protein
MTPARHTLHFVLPVIALVLASFGLGTARGQSISYTNSVTVFDGPGTTYLSLSKFDSGLGTLTGVELKLNYSRVGGSFLVTNSSGSVTVTSATMNASVFPFGAPSWSTNNFNLTSVPALPYSGIPAGSNQQFDVQEAYIWTNEIQNIDATFWSEYEAPGGGTLSLPVVNNSEVFLSDTNIATANPVGISLQTEMTITYTFVPEPSTYALLLLAGVASLAIAKRRRS